jgi:anti-anti-sigma factor
MGVHSEILGIHETPHSGGGVRLALTGELDLASAPALEARLDRLRTKQIAVHLDLSHLDFIDSSGLQVVIRAIDNGRRDGWSFTIDSRVAPQAMQILKVLGMDSLLVGEDSNGC